MKKVCIITPMIYPVPAVKGGAVEGLIELLTKENEISHEMDLTVVSVYDSEAEKKSMEYEYTHFVYISHRSFLDKFFSKKFFIYINKVGIKFRGKTLVSIPFAKAIWKKIKKQTYDKYILEGGGDCYNFGYLSRKIPANKFYVHIHGEVAGDKAFAKWFGKCITVSNFIARRLICNGIVDSSRVSVLPNCFDPALIRNKLEMPEQECNKYGLDASDFVFVYWGRILPEKGVYELLQAFSILCDKVSDAKLLIVGNATFGNLTYGLYDQKLKQLCNTEILKDKVLFTGFVPHEKLGDILSLCDVGIIPSIWDDPAPLTVFEALAKGLPVIATRVGGIPEVIKDQENGLLVEWTPDIIETLSDKMFELYSNRDLRKKLSRSALESVKKYTVENYYKQYVSLME